MDQLTMHTPNFADGNYRKLASLFPNAVTETIAPVTGEVVRAIDKVVLMQEINTCVVGARGALPVHLAGQEEDGAGGKRAHQRCAASRARGQRGPGWNAWRLGQREPIHRGR